MPIVTLDGGQSSSAVAGQTATYIRMQALLQLPGCPDTLADAQLQLVLKDFYTMTTGWRDTLGPYTINANNDTIDLNPVDQNSAIQFVESAFIFPTLGGNERTWLGKNIRQPVGGDKQLPTTYFMRDPATLVLYPVPDKAYGNVLYVYASLIPTQFTVRLPDMAFTHHLLALIDGLLARLYRMPKKPWTDAATAAIHQRDYNRAKILWRQFAERNYSSADVPTMFPPFAGRGSQGGVKATLG